MLDIDAPIFTGHSAAGLRLGMSRLELLAVAKLDFVSVVQAGLDLFQFGCVSVWWGMTLSSRPA
ncbi:MAG: hypothetical protein ACI841_001603 [Planctomycetota bacterium]|jgi:hypothetical protein